MPEHSGAGRCAVCPGHFQVLAGRRCALPATDRGRLALVAGAVPPRRCTGLAVAAAQTTQPLAVRPPAVECSGQHCLGFAHRPARRQQPDRPVADRQRAWLSLQSLVLSPRAIVYRAYVAGHGIDDVHRSPGRVRPECNDSPGSAFTNPGHDARRYRRDEPDCRGVTAIGTTGHGDAGDAVVVRAVPGRADVSVLGADARAENGVTHSRARWIATLPAKLLLTPPPATANQ